MLHYMSWCIVHYILQCMFHYVIALSAVRCSTWRSHVRMGIGHTSVHRKVSKVPCPTGVGHPCAPQGAIGTTPKERGPLYTARCLRCHVQCQTHGHTFVHRKVSQVPCPDTWLYLCTPQGVSGAVSDTWLYLCTPQGVSGAVSNVAIPLYTARCLRCHVLRDLPSTP